MGKEGVKGCKERGPNLKTFQDDPVQGSPGVLVPYVLVCGADVPDVHGTPGP